MSSIGKTRTAAEIQKGWDENPRWGDITRDYAAEQVTELQGTVVEENTPTRRSAGILWEGVNVKDGSYINALGALADNMAVQQARTGLKAVYLSGRQAAGDANLPGHIYPDQSLYPTNSMPNAVHHIDSALLRTDEIACIEGDDSVDNWLPPIVVDNEVGFGGALNVYELQKTIINTGATGTHREDQLVSGKRCGHLSDKVLISIQQHIRTLTFTCLTADVSDTPTVIITRAGTEAATLITSGVDERDQKFIIDDHISEDSYHSQNGLGSRIDRAKSHIPYVDMTWMETDIPDLELVRKFIEGVRVEYPDWLLVYNYPPSSNWSTYLEEGEITKFQSELDKMGFESQFITLAGSHVLNYDMFDLAYGYAHEQMSAFVGLQNREFEAAEKHGFTAVKYQREVGTGYFDRIVTTVDPSSSTTTLKGSTEKGQF